MADPNANATAVSNADKLDGKDSNGNPLYYRIAAMFYDARMFGLSGGKAPYAYPEPANASSSVLDQVTSLAKLLTRKQTFIDGNSYDVFDMLATTTKWILAQNPHINDNEVNSVNYKPAS